MVSDDEKRIPFWERDGFTFGLTAVAVSLVFIFVGYLLGQYAVYTVGQQSRVPSGEQNARLVQDIQERLSGLEGYPEPAETSSETEAADPDTPAPQRVEERPAATADTSPESENDVLFRVQVGAFSQRSNAESVVVRLAEQGYDASILSGPPYRVQTGSFSSRNNADAYAEELRSAGFEVLVVRP